MELTGVLCNDCHNLDKCQGNLDQLNVCVINLQPFDVTPDLEYPIDEPEGIALTVRHIADAFEIDDKLANDVYRLIVDLDSTEKYANMWEDQPYINDYSRAEKVLFICNILLDGHGVESVEGNYLDGYYQTIQLEYVNMGDTYSTTIIHDNLKEKFVLTSWGNIVENEEERFEQG
jgi:hypothetical protein|tara:strand:+ start:327 stop:851 length:525 start_codon:yes stop_codon:yes gene_type:complete